jgi:hypothetical protein
VTSTVESQRVCQRSLLLLGSEEKNVRNGTSRGQISEKAEVNKQDVRKVNIIKRTTIEEGRNKIQNSAHLHLFCSVVDESTCNCKKCKTHCKEEEVTTGW